MENCRDLLILSFRTDSKLDEVLNRGIKPECCSESCTNNSNLNYDEIQNPSAEPDDNDDVVLMWNPVEEVYNVI
ncbi:unnamed protein product [Allacma fusca]|uniref:Uncharacterized protein n=1 Tax=Allacma fusca TaxID=39272 RepID=A0A8J2JBG2_9HEXA|nr:unnamed protein product [Allacma fusca]